MDVRSSPAMMRRRIGSFNSNNDQSIIREDGMSPGMDSIQIVSRSPSDFFFFFD